MRNDRKTGLAWSHRPLSPHDATRAFVLVIATALVEGLSLLALGVPDQLSQSPVNTILAILGVASFIALVGLALWLTRDAARARRAARRAEERSREADRRQREAQMRARIAGELHDSVGHDLTAIIALTEGAISAQADAGTARVLERVNELARSGLADTRRAVASLEAKGCVGDHGGPPTAERSWNRIMRLSGEARMAGLASPFSETGDRPDDPRQAELACRVVREGVTNTLRHATGARCLVISLEHVADGSCRIAVHDDGVGESSDTESEGHGTGLHRLEARIKAAGGTIGWGPDEGGWSLEALIPSLSQGNER